MQTNPRCFCDILKFFEVHSPGCNSWTWSCHKTKGQKKCCAYNSWGPFLNGNDMRTENCLTFLCTARFDVSSDCRNSSTAVRLYSFGIPSNAKMGVERRSNISSTNINIQSSLREYFWLDSNYRAEPMLSVNFSKLKSFSKQNRRFPEKFDSFNCEFSKLSEVHEFWWILFLSLPSNARV